MSTERLAHFQSLVERQPENELFRFSLAQAFEAAGRDEEAAAQYRFCATKKPDWMMAHILLAKRLLALGRRPEAKAELEIALRLAIEQSHEDPEQEIRALLADLSR